MIKTITILALFTALSYGQTTAFQLHGTASELSAGIVTPAVGPTGVSVVNGTGAINFPGTGVYFTNCCANTNNAAYKFTGDWLGGVFGADSGQITFTLISRYTFAQRQAFGSGYRYVFDVQDVAGSPGKHKFGMYTQANTSGIILSYWSGGTAALYYAIPAASADAMFGANVSLAVKLTWGSGTFSLALNGTVVKSTTYTPPTYAWSSTSVFGIGAQLYGTGIYNSNDDILSDFVVTGSAPPPPSPPTIYCSGPYDSVTGLVSLTCPPVTGFSHTMTVTVTAGSGLQ